MKESRVYWTCERCGVKIAEDNSNLDEFFYSFCWRHLCIKQGSPCKVEKF